VTTESLTLKARPGNRTYLGATVVDGGVNFAVASTVTESVTVCLFDVDGTETRFELEDYDAGTWSGFVPDVKPGQAYGFRMTGPFDPARGLRCNPNKLLLDPYARAIVGGATYGPALLGHDADNPALPSQADSAPFVPRSLVTDQAAYD
jgi:isoamylase